MKALAIIVVTNVTRAFLRERGSNCLASAEPNMEGKGAAVRKRNRPERGRGGDEG